MANDDDVILYHYCSAETFSSIIKHKSIWLSSVSQSNDSMEGCLVSKIFFEAARQSLYEKTSTTNPNLQKVLNTRHTAGAEIQYSAEKDKELIAVFEQEHYGLSFSLSEEGDLLSQWRGYADDASGFSIGFSKKCIEKLIKDKSATFRPTLEKINYIPTTNTEKSEHGNKIFKICKDIKDNEVHTLSVSKIMDKLTPYFYTTKNEAFSEEKEWRILAQFHYEKLEKALFRTANQQIIPYIEIDTPNIKDLIKKVIIGPKNKTPENVIRNFLISEKVVKKGEGDIVSNSQASYR